MKLLKYSLFLLAPMGSLSAAVNTFTGLTPDAPLVTAQPGWTLVGDNVSGPPIAFVGVVSSNPTGALGGELADLTSTGTAKLTMSSSVIGPVASVSLDMLITDSTNSLPTRDQFGFSIANGSGATIVELRFLPVVQSFTPASDLAQWQVSYLIAGASSALSTFIINESVLNSINVVFANNGVSITLANNFDTITHGGTVSGFDSAVSGVGDLAFSWTKGDTVNGDNTMYFDNINVEAVPEPSSMLLSSVASLLLLKRRRR